MTQRTTAVAARLLAAVATFSTLLAAPARAARASNEPPRLQAARRGHEAEARALLAAAKVLWPAGAVLLRAFKDEDALELWAAPSRSAPLALVKSYKVCARSGGPGPKVQEGDGQVPEGFYAVSQLNPWSNFHLSLRVDYPNGADKARAKRLGVGRLGGDIFIHGNCVTIGCLPLEDGPIEELYVIVNDAKSAGAPVAVHLFPSRPGTPAWTALLDRAQPGLQEFWRSLVPAFEAFERGHKLPKVKATAAGGYLLQ